MNMKKNNQLPSVLGETLAGGLARQSARSIWNNFNEIAATRYPQQFGKTGRNAKFNRLIDYFIELCGSGLIKKEIFGDGKKKIANLICAISEESAGILFYRLTITARNLEDYLENIMLSARISPHAVARGVQAFKSSELKLLGKEFYSHAKQALGSSSDKDHIYTMTNAGLCVWTIDAARYVERSPPKINNGILEGTEGGKPIVCKTFIPSDSLDGKNAIRRQRWMEGLDFQ